ncbi:hypothetical protein [Paraburkholderia hayleyella]|uniref:hypothetical protein n=1 Tax=Paraburkholderia hayleyella TaxID=2152889 RepID=UPI0012911F6B|nr:hypothetical protein [Paraburkholderia hayleyella]
MSGCGKVGRNGAQRSETGVETWRGKRQASSGKRQAASGKRQAASGKRQAASGKRYSSVAQRMRYNLRFCASNLRKNV